MSPKNFLGGLPSWIWERLTTAAHRFLMCDYDGTLAPLQVERKEARPDARALRFLLLITAGARTSVAVVSGRPIQELKKFIDPVPAWLVGEHGWEIRNPDGSTLRYALEEEAQRALLDAAAAAETRGWGPHLERKRTSLVLHTRGLPSAEALELERSCALLWRPRHLSAVLRLSPCDGGIELKASGHDKGTVVVDLLRQAPAGTYSVYLGDDETDEDAFAALRNLGLGIRIGSGQTFSSARGLIESQQGVAPFLEAWLLHVEGRDPTGRRAS